MELNPSGAIAEECWRNLPQHFPSIVPDEFVVMPNHLHAILFLVSADELAVMNADAYDAIAEGAGHTATLSEGIRFFKTTSAKRINRLRGTPGVPVWQRSFYDHVIRHNDHIDTIRNYILQNPERWELDGEALHGRVAKT